MGVQKEEIKKKGENMEKGVWVHTTNSFFLIEVQNRERICDRK